MAGLERAWFTQAALDPTRQTVAGASLFGDELYVLTSAGVLQVLDAETGALRWTQRLGDGANTVVLGPAVAQQPVTDEAGEKTSRKVCAMTVGSTLYVLGEAQRGAETLMTIEVAGSPAAAPAIGEDYVYVPIISGRMTAYPFDQDSGVPFYVSSPGQVIGSPLVTKGRIVWPTAKGELYAASTAGGGAIYRVETKEPLSGSPALAGESICYATTEGTVYAITADRARELWRTKVAGQILKPIVAVGGMVYAMTDAPAMWAFDATTGELLWTVEGLSDFVSASEEHVFAVAPDGAVGVLDRKTGRPLASWPAVGALAPLTNTVNDRLYFVSEDGLIQCFHEEGLATPYFHDQATAPEDGADDEKPAATEAEPEEEPAEDASDFEMEDEPAEEPAAGGFDPFAVGDDEPADEAAPTDADDPFADF